MRRFESLLLAPVSLLGTSAAAGLNQKNSTSLTLGTQTAFDFYPPTCSGGQALYYNRRLNPKMLNGARNPPECLGGSNLVLYIIIYFWDAIREVASKPLQGIYSYILSSGSGNFNSVKIAPITDNMAKIKTLQIQLAITAPSSKV